MHQKTFWIHCGKKKKGTENEKYFKVLMTDGRCFMALLQVLLGRLCVEEDCIP